MAQLTVPGEGNERPPPAAGPLCLAGHGDYAYQQSSYTEQSYDRSFEESTQHYYEGGKSTRAARCAPCIRHAQQLGHRTLSSTRGHFS